MKVKMIRDKKNLHKTIFIVKNNSKKIIMMIKIKETAITTKRTTIKKKK
jgi:hypothetical protein